MIGVAVLVLAASGCGSDDSGRTPSAVTLLPGERTTGSVEVDGTTIEYVVVVPVGFEVGDLAPVVLALPPGGQDLAIAESLVSGTYQAQALERGWVVVSPAAPAGRLFFDGSEEHIPGFLDWIHGWVRPEGDRVHLLGVSNGGISAFRIAGLLPDRVQSIVVFPGFPRTEADRSALAELTSIPVRMYVGENDTGWIASMEQASAELRDLGGDVTIEVVAGAGHIISSLGDGRQLFDDLDAAR
jgi:pimeloyl-ACP methyl ester carboxylesterase